MKIVANFNLGIRIKPAIKVPTTDHKVENILILPAELPILLSSDNRLISLTKKGDTEPSRKPGKANSKELAKIGPINKPDFWKKPSKKGYTIGISKIKKADSVSRWNKVA